MAIGELMVDPSSSSGEDEGSDDEMVAELAQKAVARVKEFNSQRRAAGAASKDNGCLENRPAFIENIESEFTEMDTSEAVEDPPYVTDINPGMDTSRCDAEDSALFVIDKAPGRHSVSIPE